MNAGSYGCRKRPRQTRLGCAITGNIDAADKAERLIVEQMGNRGIRPNCARRRLTREAKAHFAGACDGLLLARWLVDKLEAM